MLKSQIRNIADGTRAINEQVRTMGDALVMNMQLKIIEAMRTGYDDSHMKNGILR